MAEQSIEELIAQLRNFRTRSAAADRLVALDSQAVEPLLEALERESNISARWVMINVLGEIGDPAAVPAVARHLEQSDYQTVARDTLVKIAGRDLGPLPGPWLRWEPGQERLLEEAPDGLADGLSDEELITRAVEASRARLRRESDRRYRVDLPNGGDQHRVWVVFGSSDHEGAPVVIVFANCGDANPEHYEAALRMNLQMPYGAIAVRDVGSRPHFVMFNTLLRAGLSPVELRKSITTVGARSARVAAELCD